MKDATLDLAAVRAWFTRLYGDMDGTELINIAPVNGDWSGVTGSCWELDGVVELIKSLDSGKPVGIYHRITTVINPPAPKKRGLAIDSHMIPGFWADIDIAGPGHKSKKGTLPADEAAARKIVDHSSLPAPTLWVHSGGGLYPWWLLTEPAEITPDSYASVAQLSEDLHAELERSAEDLGMSCEPMADLARVLRIPGTLNRKTSPATLCQVIEDTGMTYTIEQIRAAVPIGQPKATTTGKVTTGSDRQSVYAGLPDGPACRAMTRKLKAVSDALRAAETGSRHRTALSGIGSLAWLGNVGHMGAREAINDLGEIFEEAKPASEQGPSEWPGMVDYVVSRIEVREDRQCCGGWAFTEPHFANRIAEEIMTGAFRWSAGTGWVQWSGSIWDRCDDAVVLQEIKEWVLDGFRRATRDWQLDPSSSQLETVVKGWKSMLSKPKIVNIASLTNGIPGVWFEASEMDADPDIINCPNGVVDLRTGEIMDHSSDRLVSKITGCDYVPDAAHKDLITVLSALPEDVRDWMQLRIGQSATGHPTPDDLLCILQGSGQNAKSTFLEGVSRALGSYHVIVSDRVIMGDHTRDEVMTLQGARSAWLEETPEAAHLDVVKMKKLIGTAQVTGHNLYRPTVTWRATHSLFITTNYVPMITESDHGTWRRLALIRFPYTFVKEPKAENERKSDPTLRIRVSRDRKIHEAFLAWIIEGVRRHYAADEIMPDFPATVRKDTDDWRADVDLIMGYWRERLIHDPTRYVTSADLRADFNGWTEKRGHKGLSEKVFNARFGDHSSTTTAHVRKERIRTKTAKGLSRPEGKRGDVSEQVIAWLGVRFQDDEDPFS